MGQLNQKEDEEDGLGLNISLDDAVESKRMIKGIVDKWMADKGYAFIKYLDQTIFCHA